ncbi:hypothetical protein C9374_012818 [Naegleria lovaniensis]|uniref:Uncharacterized protein n=1 Tax=Naegleria lovaniensis TaxID=51637 RepID=A0AA88KEA8_NAELO|nr:uncharacterized protein C9374_012818 [Naegleria lovaniensis]KAG2373086.1 hypothetical protein C9374_012818 [Naegleria lovaniensis]
MIQYDHSSDVSVARMIFVDLIQWSEYDQEDSHIFKFYKKMSSRRCSFSFEFKPVGQLLQEDEYSSFSMHNNNFMNNHDDENNFPHFRGPSDIKICHNHSLIIVSDSENKRLIFFDLHFKTYKFSMRLQTNPPCCFDIEENFNGNDSIIMASVNHCVYKYHLKHVHTSLKNVPNTSPFENKSAILFKKGQHGFVGHYFRKLLGGPNTLYPLKKDDSLIFVLDDGNGRIRILNSRDGMILRSISLMDNISVNFDRVSLTFSNERCIVSGRNQFLMAIELDDSFFTSVNSIKQSMDTMSPVSAMCEMKNSQIILLREYNDTNRLTQMDTTHCEIIADKHFKPWNWSHSVRAMCFNEFTGELFILTNKNVDIYK